MQENKNNLNFVDSINRALDRAMSLDKSMICYGLGATDPKNIFSSTKNLEKKFEKKGF